MREANDNERCYQQLLTGRYKPKQEDKSRTVSIALPTKVFQELDRISIGQSISRSFFIRQLILREIENQKKKEEEGLQGLQNLGANQDATQAALSTNTASSPLTTVTRETSISQEVRRT